jgi:sigma-B regulation protein RsbU (phosphoserine phosphatase)
MAKILVIDDEKTILENIQFVLALENHDVLSTADSEEALTIFRDHYESIDTVITDMRMPKISGMELLKEIKTIFPEMSVIILTGHGDLENAITAMKEGAFEYLKKPVDADKLTIAVHNAISRKNLLVENVTMHREILEHRNYLQGMHDSAQKILLNMLPTELPKIKNYDFSIKYKSSDAVGGDMYDVSDIGDYVCFYIFDVSSHGILAAVISVILNSFLQNIEYNYKQGINKRRFPDIVKDLNMELLSNTAQNVFASLLIGFIDKKTNVLYYVSAGHITQYILTQENIQTIPSTGTILGVFEDASFYCNVIPLNKGDKIILFTDGIVEASRTNELYGFENLEKVLMQNKDKKPQEILEILYQDAYQFSNCEFLDDVTLMGIEIQ